MKRLDIRLLLLTLWVGCLAASAWGETRQRGGLVLQFDDGWSSWRTLVAPALARVGGRATGFVNNQHIHSGRIGFDDLRALQNDFGWEIGSHTYNHHNAIRFVQQQGLDKWLDDQLMRSLAELREAGLQVGNLVFPFNAYAPPISRAALERGIGSFRRAERLALAGGRRDDGSLPGTSFNLTRHLPLATLMQWVDMAHARGELLFLYGHRVLPDDAFVTGRVAQASAHELMAEADVVLPLDEDVVLVPDMFRHSTATSIGGLEVADRRRIRTPDSSGDLTRLTAPGATFLIGPAYGTRLSDFVALMEYAATRLHFYTVADVVAGRHTSAAGAAQRTAPEGAAMKTKAHRNLPWPVAAGGYGHAWRAARVPLALLLLAGAAATAGAAGGTPRIVGLQRGAEGRLTLDLALSGDPGEVIDLFATERLAPPSWRVLGAYLRAEGALRWRWTEPADGVPGPGARTRFFRVGRADIDLNENGIADAREALIHIHDLPPEARARWARAGLGDVPANFPTLLNVRLSGAKGNGVADDTAAINAVIAQAPANSVVYLPAGAYRLTQTLQLKPDMILRGDGPALTSLIFEGSGTADRCIGIMRWDSQQPVTYAALTDGMQMGFTVVTVASVAGIQVGDIIEIEEDNDPAWGLTDGWQARLPGQINRVVAVDTAQRRLTLNRHLRHTYSAARNPRLRRLAAIANVGIENLFVRRKDAVVGYTIEMKYAVRCWIRNVESYMTYKAHVWMDRAYECEVRQSYFHDSFVFGGSGQGYGVACGKRTSDCLIEDNIFRHLRHAMIVGIGANGNVYGYNFSTQRALDPVHGTPQADISVHGNYVFMNLFEGNVLEDADVPDWYWPAGPGNTLFRNRIVNSGTAINVGSHNQNFLGNVLTHGTIALQAPLSGIVDYGNVKQGDMANIGWPGCGCQTLPDSLYRSVPPDFIRQAKEVSWPPLGPDRPLEAVTPAQQRYLSGAS